MFTRSTQTQTDYRGRKSWANYPRTTTTTRVAVKLMHKNHWITINSRFVCLFVRKKIIHNQRTHKKSFNRWTDLMSRKSPDQIFGGMLIRRFDLNHTTSENRKSLQNERRNEDFVSTVTKISRQGHKILKEMIVLSRRCVNSSLKVWRRLEKYCLSNIDFRSDVAFYLAL